MIIRRSPPRHGIAAHLRVPTDRDTPGLDRLALLGLSTGIALLIAASLVPELGLLAVPGIAALLPSLLVGAR